MENEYINSLKLLRTRGEGTEIRDKVVNVMESQSHLR